MKFTLQFDFLYLGIDGAKNEHLLGAIIQLKPRQGFPVKRNKGKNYSIKTYFQLYLAHMCVCLFFFIIINLYHSYGSVYDLKIDKMFAKEFYFT